MDLKNNLDAKQSVAPAAHTSSVNGTGVDLQNYHGAMVHIHPGTITDGTHTPKLQESADNSSFSDVAAADLVGSFAAIANNTLQRVGYIGSKRYVRVVVTVSGATTGGVYGASIVLGSPRKAPV